MRSGAILNELQDEIAILGCFKQDEPSVVSLSEILLPENLLLFGSWPVLDQKMTSVRSTKGSSVGPSDTVRYSDHVGFALGPR